MSRYVAGILITIFSLSCTRVYIVRTDGIEEVRIRKEKKEVIIKAKQKPATWEDYWKNE